MYKQLFRQKLKTILGIFMIALAVTGLCVGVGQALAAAYTAEAMQYQFTTVALPTAQFQFSQETDEEPSVQVESELPPEIVRWIERTAQSRPDLVKTIASPGLASAHIPTLNPDTYLRHTYYPYTIPNIYQELLPVPLGAPYS